MTRPLRLVIAGGGTGGHVSPALAVITSLRRHLAETGDPLELLWLGSDTGVERTAATSAGIPYQAIPTGKLRRYVSLATVGDLVRLPLGLVAAYRAVAQMRPDVLFSTGGFVSVPSVYAAWLLGRPILTHEQTVTVGLANRLNARVAGLVALSYPASRAWLAAHPLSDLAEAVEQARTIRRRSLMGVRAPLVVTGNPTRPEIVDGQAARALARLGLPGDRPLVYVTGGSQGSHAINEAVAASLSAVLEHVQLVHQTGPAEANGDLPRLEALATTLPPPLRARYRPLPFVGAELADLYAATSLVVGRAGAGTVAELATVGKPSLLIPLPGASADEQTRNARMLAEAGAAVMLPEAALTPARLVGCLRELVADEARLAAMGQAVRRFAYPEAAEQLATALLRLAGR